MGCYRRAIIDEETFEGRRENLAQANKLSRTYTALLEALNRHRGKGQQKMTVEHVHVHSGGQAVVGVVEAAGGGDRAKLENQSHAGQDGSELWLAYTGQLGAKRGGTFAATGGKGRYAGAKGDGTWEAHGTPIVGASSDTNSIAYVDAVVNIKK